MVVGIEARHCQLLMERKKKVKVEGWLKIEGFAMMNTCLGSDLMHRVESVHVRSSFGQYVQHKCFSE